MPRTGELALADDIWQKLFANYTEGRMVMICVQKERCLSYRSISCQLIGRFSEMC